jgi:hypothetical protein
MSSSLIHYRQNPTENSERFYPSLFENVTERQTWVQNGMYYSESSLQFPASPLFILLFHSIIRSSEKSEWLGIIVAFGSHVEGHSLAYLNMWLVFFTVSSTATALSYTTPCIHRHIPPQMRYWGKGQK